MYPAAATATAMAGAPQNSMPKEKDTVVNVEHQCLQSLGHLRDKLMEISMRVRGPLNLPVTEDTGAPRPVPGNALACALELRNDILLLNDLAQSILNDL